MKLVYPLYKKYIYERQQQVGQNDIENYWPLVKIPDNLIQEKQVESKYKNSKEVIN